MTLLGLAHRGLVGGSQLIARARCVWVGARDPEVGLPQLIDHLLLLG